jgi:uncharacterized membrane protein YfcA
MIGEFALWQSLLFGFGVILAFAVRSGAGFGGGVVAVPVLALAAPLQMVVPVSSMLNIVSGLAQGTRQWAFVDWREMRRLLPCALIGVLTGIWLLAKVDPKPLSRAFGVFIIVYAIYMMVMGGRAPMIPQRWLMLVAAVASFFGGFIGSVFGGAAGPVFAIYLQSVHLERDPFRATMTALMIILGGTRVVGFILAGMYTDKVLMLLAWSIPLVFAGAYIGTRVVQRLDQRRFGIGVACVLLASGAILVLR